MTASINPAPKAALPTQPSASRTAFAPQPNPATLGIRQEEIIRHGSCGRWWTGPTRNHCGQCHITTSGLTAFDAHQRGGVCAHPQTAGLVAREKPWGTMWALPGDEDALARLKAGAR